MKISPFALALAAIPTVAAFVSPVGITAKGINSSFLSASVEETNADTSISSSSSVGRQPLIMVDEDTENAVVAPSVIREATFKDEEVGKDFFQKLPYGVKLTGADKLHAEGLTGKGVRVAVIDSGVDGDHPGFHDMVKEQVWFRYGSPLSQDDHGTHVAGTIHMMAPEAEIYDYRVFGDEGMRVDVAIERSIRMAVEDGCDVINMSLGGPRANWRIGRAVRYAHAQGIPMIVAAGNEGDNNPLTNERSYPATRPEVVSIAAVSKRNNLPVARFSNGNAQVDYSGIGVDVHSFLPGGGFQEMSGTSMATPHVCGLVAALLTKDGPYRKDVSDDEGLRKLLEKFTIDIGVKGPDNATGLGFLSYLNFEEFKKVESKTSIWKKINLHL